MALGRLKDLGKRTLCPSPYARASGC